MPVLERALLNCLNIHSPDGMSLAILNLLFIYFIHFTGTNHASQAFCNRATSPLAGNLLILTILSKMRSNSLCISGDRINWPTWVWSVRVETISKGRIQGPTSKQRLYVDKRHCGFMFLTGIGDSADSLDAFSKLLIAKQVGI